MTRPRSLDGIATGQRRTAHLHGTPAGGRGWTVIVAVTLCLAQAGCMGSWVIRGTRLRLNESYGDTATQEILLNIVRMRYGETPTFMDLKSIASQTEAKINGISGQTGPSVGSLLGNFTLRDAPTLTYVPRTGNSLADAMLKAIPAARLLEIAPGNDTRIFLIAFIDSINGVRNTPTAASPASRTLEPNDDFRYAIDLFLGLQDRGAVRLRVGERDVESHESLPVALPTASETLSAAKKDYYYTSSGDRTSLRGHDEFVAIVIRPEEIATADTVELTRVLRLVPARAGYEVRSQQDDDLDYDTAYATGPLPMADPLAIPEPEAGMETADAPFDVADGLLAGESPLTDVSDTLSLDVRSPYQAMAFLSKGVDVPAAHLRRGTVPTYCGLDGRPFDGRQITRGLFHVCVQKHRPLRAEVAVHYRGYWFFVAEGDVQSRSTLNFMRLVSELQSEAGTLPEAYALPAE